MADITPVSSFDAVYQLEDTDDALAGAGGVMNSQAQSLANRTQWLSDRIVGGLGVGQIIQVASSYTVDVTVDMGAMIILQGATAGQSVLFPNSAAGGLLAWQGLSIKNSSSKTWSISMSGTDTVQDDGFFGTVSKINIYPGEQILIVNPGPGTSWIVAQRMGSILPGTIYVLPSGFPISLEGWKKCDGSSLGYDPVSHPENVPLHNVIGSFFGTSGGSFVLLPNLNDPAISGAGEVSYYIHL